MPGLSVPAERSGCRSEPSRFGSGARNPAVELSGSLFDRGVVVNPRVEIARPIGTLFITPGTGAQMRRCDPRPGRTFSQHQEDWTKLLDTLTYYDLGRDAPVRYHPLILG